MSKIKIQNFGPIKSGLQSNNGWIEIEKVTVFIGNQGSGKSTVAKLISTFIWIEKALVRGDYDKKWFERKNKLKNHYFRYHRLESYFNYIDGEDESKIEYIGDAYTIKYNKGKLKITKNDNSTYHLPQIMYVPAERNFITYVKSPKELKLSSDSLKEFLVEYNNAKNNLKGVNSLPINNASIEYDRLNDILNVKGNNYRIRLSEASSGFQSLVPLYLVSEFLAKSVSKQSENKKEPMSSEELSRFKNSVKEILSNDDLTEEQKRIAISVLSSKFNKSAFINIVEEPEQNLYPKSQWLILQSLLKHNNINIGNKLLMTTHSPYIINYFSIIVKAHQLSLKTRDNNILNKINQIIPAQSTIYSKDLRIYELNEETGDINILANYEGLPSDENYLNDGLAQSNDLFSKLLDIEDLCQ